MRSRILTAVALASMLAAAGCGGGGASSALSGLTPKTTPVGGGSTASTTHSLANISATVNIPTPFTPATTSTASSGRSAQYLSPGTAGFDVLLGNCSNSTGPVQITTTENQVKDDFTGNVNSPPATTFTFGVQTTQNVNLLTPGQTILIRDTSSLPGVNFVSSKFKLTNVNVGGSLVSGYFVDQTGTDNGPFAAGAPGKYDADANTSPATANSTAPGVPPTANNYGHYFPIGSEIDLAAPATQTNQKFIIGGQTVGGVVSGTGSPQALTPSLSFSGTVPQSISGVGGSTYTVNGSSNINSSGTAPGFYTMNVQIMNVSASPAPGVKYCLGVVTLDAAGYVLSEAQQEYDVPFTGGTVETAFTLKPVVNSFIAANPALVVPPPLGSAQFPAQIVDVNGNIGPAGQNNVQTSNSGQTTIFPGQPLDRSYNAYSTVLFATDHAGYIIPEIGPSPNAFSVPANSSIGNLAQNQNNPVFNPNNGANAGPTGGIVANVFPFVNISSYAAGAPTALVEYFHGAAQSPIGSIAFTGSGRPTTPPTNFLVAAADLQFGTALAGTGAGAPIPATFSPADTVTLGGFSLGDAVGNDANLQSVFGTYISGATDPSVGTILSTTAPILSNNRAGTPLYLVCNSQAASVPYQANVFFTTITGALGTGTFNDNSGTGDVAGFTYTPGTNLPATSTLAAPKAIPLGAINCTPGIGAVIN